MISKMTKCKACGADVAKGIKACPSCGKDSRLFFVKHKIISALLIVVLLVAVSGALGGEDSDSTAKNDIQPTAQTTTEPAPEPAPAPAPAPLVVTVDDLTAALSDNALKASTTYKGQYVELTGKLSSIDSDGTYFSIGPLYDEYSFDSVLCNIKKEHLNTVMNFADGQEVTVIGTITDVGEIMGYYLDVETIK